MSIYDQPVRVLLVEMIDEFKSNDIDTSWLDGLIKEKSVSTELDPHTTVAGAAVYQAFSYAKQQEAESPCSMPSPRRSRSAPRCSGSTSAPSASAPRAASGSGSASRPLRRL